MKCEIKCTICNIVGHRSDNKRFHPKTEAKTEPSAKTEPKISQEEYDTTIAEIAMIAKSICVKKADYDDNDDCDDCDGRIDSAMKEKPFLNEMKRILQEKHPEWDVVIPPSRAPNDIIINSIRINLKLTDCKSSDNCVNKPSIYYSIT